MHTKMDETTVVDTSEGALGGKWSAVAAGYIEDEYIRYFGSGRKHGPLLNMLHFLRIKSVRNAVESFIQHFPDEPVQFVNLGCGFDTLSFWILQKYNNVTCFELDFQEQLQQKAAYMRRAKPIMELILHQEGSETSLIVTKRYKMVPANLNNMDEVKTLVSKYEMSSEQPTLFLSECALVYLNVENANEIIRFASALCNKPSCFVYWEQARTDDKFGRLLLQRFVVSVHLYLVKHTKELGNELFASTKYPTVESQIKRYKDLGWNEVTVMDMNTLYNTVVTDSEKRRIKKLECLDEVEEMVMPEKLQKLINVVTNVPQKKTVKTYTTDEVREMIKNGTLGQMEPAALNTEWL